MKLTDHQWVVLTHLVYATGNLLTAHIADRSLLPLGSVQVALSQLEAAGYVERSRMANRLTVWTATDAGRKEWAAFQTPNYRTEGASA